MNGMAETKLGVVSNTDLQHGEQTEPVAPGLDVRAADEALKAVRGINYASAELDEVTCKRILRKIDFILLPVSLCERSHQKLTCIASMLGLWLEFPR